MIKSWPVYATGYHPTPRLEEARTAAEAIEYRLEGGPVDCKGFPLHTLSEFLNRQAPFVSIATQQGFFKYGTMVRIPELELKFGRRITFLAVDYGGNIGSGRVDICCKDDDQADRIIGNMTPMTLVAWIGDPGKISWANRGIIQ